ncbi:MAG: hypothetical protein O2897_00775 [bacterium]|nr:hypothetical protein [bacterium]
MKKFSTTYFLLLFFSLSLPASAKLHRYISLDAGGMLGIIPSQILNEIENETQKPIFKLVNGIMGTSTGSIISALLAIPADNKVPSTAKYVSSVYENYGNDLFHVILKSYISNTVRMILGQKPLYNEANETYNKISLLISPHNRKLSDALIDLFIVSTDKDSMQYFIFNSKNPAHHQIDIHNIVKASTSIFNAFGTHSVEIPGEGTRNFIDAGYETAGYETVVDPTFLLHQQLKNSLPPGDRAIIYSLGTGFEYLSSKTKHLIERNSTNSRINIIRIQPNVNHLAGGEPGSLFMSLFAADTSLEAIENLKKEAKRLTPEYKIMLMDLKKV